jgi:phosphoglycolate phosphatase
VRFRLVLFDLDGTLVDSRRDLADAANAMLADYGGQALPEAAIGAMVGDGARTLVERALAAAGVERQVDEALSRFLAHYDPRMLNHTRPYPGVPELLARAAALAPVGVLTNKPLAASVRVLEALDLARPIWKVIGGDGPWPRKPSPDGLLHLAREIGAAPAETLLVGDSPIDFETAQRAGCALCVAAYGFGYTATLEPRVKAGDRIARSPDDVSDLLTA